MNQRLAIRIAGGAVAFSIGLMGFIAPSAQAAPDTSTTAAVAAPKSPSRQNLDQALTKRLNVKTPDITAQTSKTPSELTTAQQQISTQISKQLDTKLPQLTDAQKQEILKAVQAIWNSSKASLGSVTIPAIAAALTSAGPPEPLATPAATIIWNVIATQISNIIQDAIDDQN